MFLFSIQAYWYCVSRNLKKNDRMENVLKDPPLTGRETSVQDKQTLNPDKLIAAEIHYVQRNV